MVVDEAEMRSYLQLPPASKRDEEDRNCFTLRVAPVTYGVSTVLVAVTVILG